MKFDIGDIVLVRTNGDSPYEVIGWTHKEIASLTYKSKIITYSLRHLYNHTIVTKDESLLIYFGQKVVQDEKEKSKEIDRILDQYNSVKQEFNDNIMLFEEFQDPDYLQNAQECKRLLDKIMNNLNDTYKGV